MNLNNITLVAVTNVEIEAHVKALEYSSREITFGRVLLLAPEKPHLDGFSYDHIRIDGFADVGEWGEFICFELYKFINEGNLLVYNKSKNSHLL